MYEIFFIEFEDRQFHLVSLSVRLSMSEIHFKVLNCIFQNEKERFFYFTRNQFARKIEQLYFLAVYTVLKTSLKHDSPQCGLLVLFSSFFCSKPSSSL